MTRIELLKELCGYKKLNKENQNEIDSLIEEAVQKYKQGADDAYTMIDIIYNQFQLDGLDEEAETEIKNNLLLILKKDAGYFLKEDFLWNVGGQLAPLKPSLKETVSTGDSIQGPDSNRFTSINKRTKSSDGLFRSKPKKKPQDAEEDDIDKKLQLLKNLFNDRSKKKITITDIKKILQSESLEQRSNVKSKMLAASALIEDEPECKQELLEHYFEQGNILNDSSPTTSTFSHSAWSGYKYVRLSSDNIVIHSNTFLVQNGSKLSQDKISELKAMGITIY